MTPEEYEAENKRLCDRIDEQERFIAALCERILAAHEVLAKLAEKSGKPRPCWLAERYMGKRCELSRRISTS